MTSEERNQKWADTHVSFVTVDGDPEKNKALEEAFQRKLQEKLNGPEKTSPVRRTRGPWTPPPEIAGYEGLMPQNDEEWALFARTMFPTQKNPGQHIGAWKKRVSENAEFWLKNWENIPQRRAGWAQWKALRGVTA